MLGLYTDSSEDQFGIFDTLEPALGRIGMDRTTTWPPHIPDATFGVS